MASEAFRNVCVRRGGLASEIQRLQFSNYKLLLFKKRFKEKYI